MKYLVSAMFIISCLSFQFPPKEIKAKVDIIHEKDITSFTSICENQTNTKYTLTYSLEIEKKRKIWNIQK